jgi:hypothetical protein
MEPSTGDVSRIKVFTKSTFKPESSYELVYDDDVKITNTLTDSGSYLIEYPLGVFDDSQTITLTSESGSTQINPIDYWEVSASNAPIPTKKVSSGSLFGMLSLEQSTRLSGSSELIVTQTSSIDTKFYRNTDYRLKFDYYIESHPSESREPRIDAYLVGDSVLSNSEYGRFIGGVPTGSQSQKINFDYEIQIPVTSDSSARIRIDMRFWIYTKQNTIIHTNKTGT